MAEDTRSETSVFRRWAQLYFNPSGRIGRREWWLHGVLGVMILAVCAILWTVFGALATIWAGGSTILLWVVRIVGLPLLVAAVWAPYALGVKRMHDRDKSAWWFVAGVAVAAVGVALGVFMLGERQAVIFPVVMWSIWMGWSKGSERPNRYG